MPSDFTIEVVIPPESQSLIRGLSMFSTEVPQAIKRGMDRGMQIVRGKIQETRLSGQGPYPPAEQRLGERTGQLKGSLRAEPAVVAGNTITASIGTPVIYGKVHEFGMTIYPRSAKYLVFQIEGKTIFASKSVIPERAPVRTGVIENMRFITDEIAAELTRSMQRLPSGSF